ncbi:MAG: ABC transporter permease [Anaerolineae bacterium]
MTPQTIFQIFLIGLSNGAIIAFNAIAITLVYSVVRILNLAQGDIFALSTVAAVTLVRALGLNLLVPWPLLVAGIVVAVAGTMLFGVLLNVVVERLAFRPFRGHSRLAPFIATLGLSFIFYQIALVWRRFEPSFIPQEHRSVPGLPEFPGDGIPPLIPQVNLLGFVGSGSDLIFSLKDFLALALAIVCALLVARFLARSRLGRAIRGVAQEPRLAVILGIPFDRTVLLTFAIGGALTGIAAFASAGYYEVPYTHYGAESGLTAFAAAIIGGIGSPVGALIGALVVGELTALSDYFLAAQWTPVVVEGILIALLLIRPTGLAPDEGEEDLYTSGGRDAITAAGRANHGQARRWLSMGLLALGLAYPFIDSALSLQRQYAVTGILVFVLLALGVNVLLGFSGVLDLGYAASFGIGAYAAAILTAPYGPLSSLLPGAPNFLIVAAVGAAASGLYGLLMSLFALRLRRDYLAIITLAAALVVRQIILNLGNVTGGVRGMSGLPGPVALIEPLQSPTAKYYLTLAFVIAAAAISYRLLYSKLGRAWLASADDELAAQSSGIAVGRVRGAAFILSAALAGIAGALFASLFSYVDPEQLNFQLTVMTLAAVIVGGPGNIIGVILGAFVVSLYDRVAIPVLNDWLAGLPLPALAGARINLREFSYLAFGLILYLTVLYRGRRSSG